MGKRDAQILELLGASGRMEVAALAEAVGVSQVTLRKDLDALAAQGLVTREHGAAVLGNPNDITGRLAYHYEEKLRIAARATELVADGETFMLESGSCCALLARAIFERRTGATMLTNSAFIAAYVRDVPGAQTVLLGGAYQNDAQVNVGPLVRAGAAQFVVNTLFVGTDGYTTRDGFTNADHLRAQAVRDMAERADRVVVLTESEKFSQRGAVPLALGERALAVVTDAGIGDDMRAELEAQGVKVITA